MFASSSERRTDRSPRVPLLLIAIFSLLLCARPVHAGALYSGALIPTGALAIVTAVAKLASALQLEVTAEGVENNEQTKLLRELGCTSLQGFLFAKPMTEGDMRQYVATDYTISGLPGVPWQRINSVTGEVVA